eukprot:gene29677-5093_t
MAAPSGPSASGPTLRPLYATHPNETRLQELLNLQRRKVGQSPGPGAYTLPGFQAKTTFRRTNTYQLDGPFLPNEGYTETTRSKEITQSLRRGPDSGLAPGTYNSHTTKDQLMRQAPSSTIGTGARGGRNEHAKSLSLSRSIQYGIDWHVPVVIKIRKTDEVVGVGDEKDELQGDKRRGRRKAATDSSTQPKAFVPRAPKSAPEASFEGRDRSPSPDKEMHAMPPMPPSAVARSVRKQLLNAPGEWDWSKLGHNYRSNWTTLHGGAYSHGDRSTARKDKPQYTESARDESPARSQEDALDEDGFQSIDPAMLPYNNDVGDTMFPIPEEYTDAFMDIGSPSRSPNPEGYTSGMDFSPMGTGTLPTSISSADDPRSYPSSAPAGVGTSGIPSRGQAGPSQVGLSRAEVGRRDAAAKAAAFVQASAMRRSEWMAKSDMLAT